MTAPQPLPVAEPVRECKCCFEKINPADQFCQQCGFPLRATKEEQDKFIYLRGYQKSQVKELNEKASYAAITFYIIAGLLLLYGLVEFFINAQNDDSIAGLIIYGILSMIFLALGVWSNKKPVAAIICGIALYVVLMLLQAAGDPSSFARGLVIKGLIIAGLAKALVSALEAEKIKKQHNF